MSGYCNSAKDGYKMAAMETNTPLYDFVMVHLRAKKVPQKQIARESGVPFSTVCKIAQGAVTEPSVHTIQKLHDYFRTLESSPEREAA